MEMDCGEKDVAGRKVGEEITPYLTNAQGWKK